MNDIPRNKGFTIVELLVVITVIAILAGLTMVSFGAWQTRAARNAVRSDLIQAAASLKSARNFNSEGKFPSTLSFTSSPDVTITPTIAGDGSGFCLIGQSDKVASVNYYMNSQTTEPQEGTSCTVS